MLHTSSPAGGSVLALNASLEIAFSSVIITSSRRIPAEACFSLAFEPLFCGKKLRLQLLQHSRIGVSTCRSFKPAARADIVANGVWIVAFQLTNARAPMTLVA
jgi:hypothetical protein